MDGFPQRVRRTEELYQNILCLFSPAVLDEAGGETMVRGRLDAIFNAGKIDGRMTMLVDESRIPKVHERWRLVVNVHDVVHVLNVATNLRVTYTRDICLSCERPTTESRSLEEFLDMFEPVTEPVVDGLIEGWQRIVDSVD